MGNLVDMMVVDAAVGIDFSFVQEVLSIFLSRYIDALCSAA